MSKKKPEKYVLPRHRFWFGFVRPLVRSLCRTKWHYKRTFKYDLKHSGPVFIISNHQTNLDPILIASHFNRPIYFVATDNVVASKGVGRLLTHCFAPIPKKKGATDIQTAAKMYQIIREGGSVGVFLEGNRTYAEFQYWVSPSFLRFVRQTKIKVLLFAFHGGTGSMPRWGHKPRRGPFYGEIAKEISYEEYSQWSDEEFLKVIMDNIRVFDSESGEKFVSPMSAEYLEKFLFVCPVCGKKDQLRSKGTHLYCNACGLDVEYGEDLHFHSENPNFKFSILNDWYQYSREWVKNYEPEEIIFEDEGTLLQYRYHEKKQTLYEGKAVLTPTEFRFGKRVIRVSSITSASPFSGGKLIFSDGEKDYIFVGHERFNPVKYVMMFHRLSPSFDKNDHYFSLTDSEE